VSSQADRIGLRDLAAPVVAATIILATAAADGGYFPRAWGWSAVALSLAAAAALLVGDRLEVTRLELVTLGALAGFAGWAGVSALWSASASRSIFELHRDLVYVAAAAAFLLLTRRRAADLLAWSVLAAAAGVCSWGLATQLFPDRFGLDLSSLGHRLARPVGYWNALAIIAVMAALLAVGAAASSARGRGLGAGLVPILAVTIYLTQGRSAWLALTLGLGVLVALHPRRGYAGAVVAALALPAAAGVWLAARSPALTAASPALDDAARAGHRLFVALAPIAFVAAAVPAIVDRLARRAAPHLRLSSHAVLSAAALLAVAGLVALVTLTGRVYETVRSPAQRGGGNPNARTLSASAAARADYWRIAWHDVEAHPLLGSGAGTYGVRWYRERPNTYAADDAHELYLEALAEVGPIGLALLLLALAPPLVAARRPRTGLIAAAAAAYCAYLAHAAVDWDWEMPAATLTALACAWAVLAGARPERPPVPLRAIARAVALAVAACVIAIATVGYLGSTALERSAVALRAGDFPAARVDARRAARLQPWSPLPWRILGDIEGAAGHKGSALADYRHMLAKEPNDWFAWYAVAIASEGAARTEAARAGLRLNPRSPELAALLNP
jgi:hypothetical protein